MYVSGAIGSLSSYYDMLGLGIELHQTSPEVSCPHLDGHELDLKNLIVQLPYMHGDTEIMTQNFQSDESTDHGMSGLTWEFASCGECQPLFLQPALWVKSRYFTREAR